MAQISSGAIFIRLEPFIGCPKCCLAKISWSFSGPLGPNWLQLSWWDSFQSLTHFEVKRAERRKKSKITSFQFRSIKNYQKPPKMRYTWVFFSVAGNRHPSSKCLHSPAMKNNIILSIYVAKQFHKFIHHMVLPAFQTPLFWTHVDSGLGHGLNVDDNHDIATKDLRQARDWWTCHKNPSILFCPFGRYVSWDFIYAPVFTFFSTPFLSSQSSFIVKTFFISDGRRSKEKYRVENIPTKISAGSSNFWCLWFV